MNQREMGLIVYYWEEINLEITLGDNSQQLVLGTMIIVRGLMLNPHSESIIFTHLVGGSENEGEFLLKSESSKAERTSKFL